jgi:hypothetical protein
MNKRFGFELEIQQAVSSHRAMTRIINKALDISGFGGEVEEDEDIDCWTLKTDHCGWEITSPALNTTLENLDKVGKWTKAMKAGLRGRTERELFYNQTGLHVHLDLQDRKWNGFNKSNLARAFIKFEPTLIRLNDKVRSKNHCYCLHLREQFKQEYANQGFVSIDDLNGFLGDYDIWLNDSKLAQIQKLIRESDNSTVYNEDPDFWEEEIFEDHCSAINFNYNHDTFECRHGLATLNNEQIQYWIGLLILLGDAASKNRISLNHKDMIEFSGIKSQDIRTNTQALIAYLRKTNYTKPWMRQLQRNVIRWINKKMAGNWKNTSWSHHRTVR